MSLSCKSSLNVYSPRPWLVFGGVTMERFCGLWAWYSRTPALPPHPSLPYTAFSFNMRRVNAWLSLIITSACRASVPSDLCAYVEVHCMYLRIGPELHPSGVPPCDELSCSAAGGFERRIITSCPSAGSFLALVRITWSLQSICWALTQYTWQCY